MQTGWDMTKLAVNEIFGPTWQGEGPSAGRVAGFLRLAGCNLSCTWCDSKYTWDYITWNKAVEVKRLGVDEIVRQLLDLKVDYYVITGGEPLLQQNQLHDIVYALRDRAEPPRIEVETNGTIKPGMLNGLVDQYNVSPKLANSTTDGSVPAFRFHNSLWHFARAVHSIFKFVVSSASDLEEVDKVVRDCAIHPSRVWIMPEGMRGVDLDQYLQDIAEPTLARRYNLSDRLHIRVWGNIRGR